MTTFASGTRRSSWERSGGPDSLRPKIFCTAAALDYMALRSVVSLLMENSVRCYPEMARRRPY